jgi:trehalose 2-sulfotransferase
MTKPHFAYFICTTPRTGSSFLTQLLHSTHIAGRPREYFAFRHTITGENQRKDTLPGFIKTSIERGTTPNGVFAAKLFWDHFRELTNIFRQSSANGTPDGSIPQLLSSVFPDLNYIWLTRRDKARQAVSLDRAVQTKIWDSKHLKARVSRIPPTFCFDRINVLYHLLLANDESWRSYFAANQIVPFTLTYEDLIEGYEKSTKAILEYFKIPGRESISIEKPAVHKMADSLSEEWVQEYLRIKQQCPEKTIHTHRRLAILLGSLWETEQAKLLRTWWRESTSSKTRIAPCRGTE